MRVSRWFPPCHIMQMIVFQVHHHALGVLSQSTTSSSCACRVTSGMRSACVAQPVKRPWLRAVTSVAPEFSVKWISSGRPTLVRLSTHRSLVVQSFILSFNSFSGWLGVKNRLFIHLSFIYFIHQLINSSTHPLINLYSSIHSEPGLSQTQYSFACCA